MTAFFPAKALAEHVSGSFEAIREAVAQAIQEQAMTLFAGSKAALLATHESHCVVVVEGRGAFAVSYAVVDGGVVFGTPSALDVPVVDAHNVGTYTHETAREVVRALLAGDTTRAKEVSLSLVPLAPIARQAGRDGSLQAGSRPLSVWESLLRKQVRTLPEATEVLSDSAPRAEVVEAARNYQRQVQDLASGLKQRYAAAVSRELHEGAGLRCGELSLGELKTLVEGVYLAVYEAEQRLALLLAREAPTADLREHVNQTPLALYHLCDATAEALLGA